MLRLTASRSRRRFAASILNLRHASFFNSFFEASPSAAPSPRASAKTIRASIGDFTWRDEYSWMEKRRNAEEFARHLAAESTFASAALSELAPLAASLAAEARRYVAVAPADCGSPFADSVPERIGGYFYFTRTGEAGGEGEGGSSCSLLRRPVSKNDEEEELVVDVAEVAASQGACSLGQLKLSPCGRAVAMTLDVGSGGGTGGGSGGEFWRAVVVEAAAGAEARGGKRVLGSVDGVTSVEWGAASHPAPSSSSSSSPLSLPALFYTRGGAGSGGSGGGPAAAAAATLHRAPWDAAARAFLFDENSSASPPPPRPPPPPLFSERDPSRVLALGRSKDGALLTLASAAAGGSAAYALWLRREGSGGGLAPPPPSPPLQVTRVAPFEEGVEHYLEHCDGVPGGLVVMTTAAKGRGSEEGASPAAAAGEFWLAAPLAKAAAAAGPPDLSPPASIPPPSEWTALLPSSPRRSCDGAAAVLTDIDVYRRSILCYERCASSGRPRLSLLRFAGRGGGSGSGSDVEVKTVALPSSADFFVVRPGANADPDAATARVTLSGPLAPPRDYDLCLETGEWLPLPSSSSSASPSPSVGGLEVAIEKTPGGVPVTLVRRRRRNSKSLESGEEPEQEPRPVLLTLYGCYGLSVDAGFDPVRLALAAGSERGGGVGFGGFDLAFAHLRGGGELGRRWHAAGRGDNRGRVAEDAREVVEWLSRGNGRGSDGSSGAADGGGGARSENSSRPRRRPVALVAESAGALAACALLADPAVAPLLSAVSLSVPFVDVLAGVAEGEGGDDEEDEEDEERRRRQRSLFEHERGEFSPPASSSASASASTASALAAVCPYHLLSELERKQKEKSPAPVSLPGPPVLVALAENDARVPAAGVAKWVARLRRLRSGGGSGKGDGKGKGDGRGNAVLLQVLRGCGHAEGLRDADDIDANAREAAFLVAATEKWAEEQEKT